MATNNNLQSQLGLSLATSQANNQATQAANTATQVAANNSKMNTAQAQADNATAIQSAINANKAAAASGKEGVVLFDASGTPLSNTQTSTSTAGATVNTPVTTTGPSVSNPTTTSSTDKGTITGGSNSIKDKVNGFDATNNQTNKVAGDAIKNYDINNATDLVQMKNQVGQAQQTADANQAELIRYQLEKQKLADEEIARSTIQAEKEAANLKLVQDTENASNAAAIAAAKAKSEAAERELEIANDVELQKSNVSFAKLGLTLSTASITSAQQIFTTGVYNLSKLKSDNAFKLADLQHTVAKTEFEHTQAINKIIDGASEKSYTIRKDLNDSIHDIQNSLIQNVSDRQKNIDLAIDTYQKNIKDNEEEVLSKMNKANEVLSNNVKSLYERKAVIEKYNTDKINTFVTSGKWIAMTPQAQVQYEKGAGLPIGTVARQVTAMIGQKIYTLAKSNTGLKGLTFSSGDYATMNTEAQRLVNQGVPLDTAINQVLTEFVSNTPEYRAALAKANKAGATKGGGGGGTKATKASYTYQTVIGEDGKPHRIEVQKGGGTTRDLGVSARSVNPNPKTTTTATGLPW